MTVRYTAVPVYDHGDQPHTGAAHWCHCHWCHWSLTATATATGGGDDMAMVMVPVGGSACGENCEIVGGGVVMASLWWYGLALSPSHL